MHHTKDKGDLGVLKAQIDLLEQGITILNPLTEHSDFRSNVCLRVKPPKNSQKKHIRLASDYRRIP